MTSYEILKAVIIMSIIILFGLVMTMIFKNDLKFLRKKNLENFRPPVIISFEEEKTLKSSLDVPMSVNSYSSDSDGSAPPVDINEVEYVHSGDTKISK